jgi:hypothetical protein
LSFDPKPFISVPYNPNVAAPGAAGGATAANIDIVCGVSVGFADGNVGSFYNGLAWIMMSMSHEIAEAMTDPVQTSAGLAWHTKEPTCCGKGNCEIGDWCTQIASGNSGDCAKPTPVSDTNHVWGHCTYPNGAIAQVLYSNKDGGCTAPGSDWDKHASKPTTIMYKVNANAKVWNAAKMILIFWGDQWQTQTNPSKQDVIDNFNLLLQTQYFSVLSQYDNIQPPTLFYTVDCPDSVIPAITNNPQQLTEAEIVTGKCIDAGLVPTPDYQGAGTFQNFMYHVLSPKDVNQPNNAYGGYHGYFQIQAGLNKWQPTCPTGQHWDETLLKCVDDIPTGGGCAPNPAVGLASSMTDKFGVKQFYPTKSGSTDTEWYLDVPNINSDARVKISGTASPKSTFVNGKVGSGSPPSFRINVSPTTNHANGTPDHSKARSQGFMRDAKDYRNVEMTDYHRVNGATDNSEEMTHYTRGGDHTDSNHGCTGTALKPGIQFNGAPSMKKEYWHSGGYWSAGSSDFTKAGKPLGKNPGSIIGKWIGQKTIVYDMDNGNTAVDEYYDGPYSSEPMTPANNWVQYFHMEDDGKGSMGALGISDCKASSKTEQFLWGGPVTTFRIDKLNSSGVDVKFASIREIDVKGSPPPPPPPPPGGGGGDHCCPAGQHWDDTQQACVPDDTGGGQCPEGQHYDEFLKKCVDDGPPPPPPLPAVRHASGVWLVWNVNYDTVDLCFGGL